MAQQSVLRGIEIGSRPADALSRGITEYRRGNYRAAFGILGPLAEQGNADAQTILGRMYDAGEGVPQDPNTAASWYRQAAEQGNTTAQLNIGNMKFKGRGTPQSYPSAGYWYGKAAEQGNAAAQLNLGKMYLYGDGFTRNVNTASFWLSKAAAQGDESARELLRGIQSASQSSYSQQLLDGVNAFYRNDYPTAWRLLRPIAESGNAEAQRTIGVMYKFGRGTKINQTAALIWYGKAAENGDSIAQYVIGEALYTGDGIPQNYKLSAKWHLLAAEQRYSASYARLGEMYAFGRGVPLDYIEAHKWLNLAAAKSDPDARTNLELVASQMTPEAIAHAQDLAMQWIQEK